MTEIVLEQRIAAPPSTVYRFLTESEKWKPWQGVDANFDARVGGIFSMFMGNDMAPLAGNSLNSCPTGVWCSPGDGSTDQASHLDLPQLRSNSTPRVKEPGWFSPTARFLRAKQLPRRWVATTCPGWPWWQRAGYPISTRARAGPT